MVRGSAGKFQYNILHLGGVYPNVRVTVPIVCPFLWCRLFPGTIFMVNRVPSLPKPSSVSPPPPVIFKSLSFPSPIVPRSSRARLSTVREPLPMSTSGLGFLSPTLSFQTCVGRDANRVSQSRRRANGLQQNQKKMCRKLPSSSGVTASCVKFTASYHSDLMQISRKFKIRKACG